jgi:hypothetical protein
LVVLDPQLYEEQDKCLVHGIIEMIFTIVGTQNEAKHWEIAVLIK